MQWLRTGVTLPLKGHLTMSGDFIGRPDSGEVLLAAQGRGQGYEAQDSVHD